jgi:fructose/tagatose bisphosphate aldolase
MLTNMKNSNRIKNRLIECVESGELTLGDIIEIIQYLVNKVNLVTQARYALKHKISRASVKKRLDSGKEAFVEIIGNRFIID